MSAPTPAASDGAGFVAPDVPSDAIVNTCIKCGLCLPTCPTYVLTLDERSSPRGRINLIQEVLEANLPADDSTFTSQMFECLGCRNCEPVCPSGVKFGALLEDARAQIVRASAISPGSILTRLAYDMLLGSRIALHAASAVIAFVESSGARAFARRTGLIDAFGLTRLESLLPVPHGRPFVARDQRWPAQSAKVRGSAALFVGCVMGAFFGDVHRSTVRVLARNSWNVEVPPGQGCCGALHLHAGYKSAARAFARRTIAAFESSDADRIAVNSAGCGAALKEYGELLADDPAWAQRAKTFSRRVRDAIELVDGAVQSSGQPKQRQLRVAYQDACHLAHAQGVRAQPRRAIDAIDGVDRVEMAHADRCCGSAGVYGLTHPAAADRLADMKIEAARDAGAQRIITANPGCQIQLSAAASRVAGPRVQHIMDLLDDPLQGPCAHIDRRHAVAGGLLLAAGATVLIGAAILLLRARR